MPPPHEGFFCTSRITNDGFSTREAAQFCKLPGAVPNLNEFCAVQCNAAYTCGTASSGGCQFNEDDLNGVSIQSNACDPNDGTWSANNPLSFKPSFGLLTAVSNSNGQTALTDSSGTVNLNGSGSVQFIVGQDPSIFEISSLDLNSPGFVHNTKVLGITVSTTTISNVQVVAQSLVGTISGTSFDVPEANIIANMTYDVNGAPASVEATATADLTGTYDPVAQTWSLDVPLSGGGESISVHVSGTLTTVAPINDPGPPQTVECNLATGLGEATLNGSLTSDPQGGSLKIEWTNLTPWTPVFLGAGPILSVSLPVGVNSISESSISSNGTQSISQTTVTVQHTLPPIIDVPGAAPTVVACAPGAPVTLPLPTIVDACSPSTTLTGTVTSINGVSTGIPVAANGTVTAGPGVTVVQWTAVDASGLTSTVNETFNIVETPTFLGVDGVTVDDGSIVNGTLYSGAGGQFVLQDGSQVGAVLSLSPVLLQDRVHAPSVESNAGITFGNNDIIGSTSTATPTVPPFPNASATFTGTTAITVNPSPEAGDVVTLAPGQYGAVIVYSRGQLILSAGDYEFTSLDLEPQGQLVVPSASTEAARVFVENSVIYRGSTNITSTSSSPPPAPLFLVYAGRATLTIGSPFTGTIIAPNAQLALQSLNNTGIYSGEFFAKQITISPNTTVDSAPFTCQP